MIYDYSDMTKETIEQIKKNLIEEEKQLVQDLSGFARRDSNIAGNYDSEFPDFGTDEGENAAEVAEYSDRLSLEHQLEKQLADVRKALAGIEAGTYGTCQYCGNPIEEARLLIRPTSTSCVSCKKKLKGEA
jgi:DnaK suppressor protein